MAGPVLSSELGKVRRAPGAGAIGQPPTVIESGASANVS